MATSLGSCRMRRIRSIREIWTMSVSCRRLGWRIIGRGNRRISKNVLCNLSRSSMTIISNLVIYKNNMTISKINLTTKKSNTNRPINNFKTSNKKITTSPKKFNSLKIFFKKMTSKCKKWKMSCKIIIKSTATSKTSTTTSPNRTKTTNKTSNFYRNSWIKWTSSRTTLMTRPCNWKTPW